MPYANRHIGAAARMNYEFKTKESKSGNPGQIRAPRSFLFLLLLLLQFCLACFASHLSRNESTVWMPSGTTTQLVLTGPTRAPMGAI